MILLLRRRDTDIDQGGASSSTSCARTAPSFLLDTKLPRLLPCSEAAMKAVLDEGDLFHKAGMYHFLADPSRTKEDELPLAKSSGP